LKFAKSRSAGLIFVAPTCCKYDRAGLWYETYSRRRHRQQTLSASSSDTDGEDTENSDADFDEDDEAFLRTLDPKEWRVCLKTLDFIYFLLENYCYKPDFVLF